MPTLEELVQEELGRKNWVVLSQHHRILELTKRIEELEAKLNPPPPPNEHP